MPYSDTEENNEENETRCRSLSLRSDVRRGRLSLSPSELLNIQGSLNQLHHSMSNIQLLKEQLDHETASRLQQLNMAVEQMAMNFRKSSIGRYLDSLDMPIESRDRNNNRPVNDDEISQKSVASSAQKTLKASNTPVKTLKSRLLQKRKGTGRKGLSTKHDYVLVPLSTGMFGDVLQKKPNGKPKFTDVMTVIYQGTANHKNVNTESAQRYEDLATLEDSTSKKLYYVKPVPEQFITLQDLLKQRKGRLLFTEFQAKFLCASLMLAVKFLNENDIVHGSLMPKKIIFNDKYYPQIAYFSSAEVFSERWSRFRTRMPLEYTAPEQCYEDIYENTDVFAVGVIVYEAIFGRPPHLGPSEYETRKNLCNPKFVPAFDSSKISVPGQRFLRHCLRKSGNRRFDLTDLEKGLFASVPWFDDLLEDRIFEQTFPSPLAAKIQTYKKEQKCANTPDKVTDQTS